MAGPEFNPDWYSPTGDTIATLLKERGIEESDFAVSMHLTDVQVRGIMEGTEPVTQRVAEKLAEVLGSTVRFWLAREERYRKDKARLDRPERKCDEPS